MENLPVELVRLVFGHCDLASVKALRLMDKFLADIGYEFLIPAHFTALAWRDDVARLASIAGHPHPSLPAAVRSVTFNLAEVDEYTAHHATFFHPARDAEERSAVVRDAWSRYAETRQRRDAVPELGSRADELAAALARLPNLDAVDVSFTQCPIDSDAFRSAFAMPNCRRIDRLRAARSLAAIVAAMTPARVASFAVDRLPLEIFRSADDRRHWFSCGRAFAHLDVLRLTIDPSLVTLPSSKFRALNGLGHQLRFSPNLRELTLAFEDYNKPIKRFTLLFRELLGDDDFVFPRLEVLRLEGLSCEEDDLRSLLARHGRTLRSLHLGGVGLENGSGGIYLCRGSFKSLFMSLRHARMLPKLESLCLDGRFSSIPESYHFIPDTEAAPPDAADRGPRCRGSDEFEKYLIHGGPYPTLG